MEKGAHCKHPFLFFVYIERNYFMKKGDILWEKSPNEFPNKGLIDIEGQKVIVKKR